MADWLIIGLVAVFLGTAVWLVPNLLYPSTKDQRRKEPVDTERQIRATNRETREALFRAALAARQRRIHGESNNT